MSQLDLQAVPVSPFAEMVLTGRPQQFTFVKQTYTCQAHLAQSAERKALSLVVVGSSPTVGAFPFACCN